MNYKTVLITGASSGFGEATARLLAEHEYRLILVARRHDRLEKLQKELRTDVHIASVDVQEKKQVEKFFQELPDDFQDIDVLINNAGLAAGLEPSQDTVLENWERMVDTNIKGLLYFTRFTLELMKKTQSGMIINIGSIAGNVPYKGGNVYGATKAFVSQFSKNLRTDLLGTDIKVTNIEPGAAETEFSLVRFNGDVEKAKRVYEGMRSVDKEDVANTIYWVLQQPARVNIDNIVLMPIDQTYGGLAIQRKSIQ